jgi:pSer/pThr/pTyr-binding forkhead associated (FHA) protein
MSAVIILIFRTLAVIFLYLFLGYIIFILWKDLFKKNNKFNDQPDKVITIKILNSEKSYSFTDKVIFIGRSESANIQLVNDDAVSNMHTRIFFDENNWWVEDLQSTNGTFLNEEPLVVQTAVTSADQIMCGNTILEIILPDTLKLSAI